MFTERWIGSIRRELLDRIRTPNRKRNPQGRSADGDPVVAVLLGVVERVTDLMELLRNTTSAVITVA
jgi:hypothetical protein